jgi:hypothetical protein
MCERPAISTAIGVMRALSRAHGTPHSAPTLRGVSTRDSATAEPPNTTVEIASTGPTMSHL